MSFAFRFLLAALCATASILAPAYAVGFNAEQCRAHVEQKICVKQNQKDEKCRDDRAAAVQEILRIFDIYPPLLQRSMCALERINIVENFYASGDVTRDRNITLRADLVSGNVPLSVWASWKEQLPFSEHFNRYVVDDQKAFVTALYRADVNGTLLFILTHEMAHVLDNANKVTSEKNQAFTGKRWENASVTDRLKPYYVGDELCFYSVCTPAVAKDWNRFYRTIGDAGFVSLYAMSNPGEDFAELTTFVLMKELAGLRYFIHTPDGATYDLIKQLDQPPLRSQVSYIRSFLSSPDTRSVTSAAAAVAYELLNEPIISDVRVP